MGLLAALNAGKTSLLASQKAIEITGANITNVNTEGYSRQTPELVPYPAMAFGDFFIGTGVKVGGIQREHDVFLAAQLKDRSASFGYESVRQAPLEEIEQIIGIDEETSIASQMDRFFDSIQQLTNNPNGLVERSLVIQQGELLATSFNETYKSLQGVSDDLNNTLANKVDGINLKLDQVAELNQRISTIEANGQSANTDRDRRDLLLKELAQEIGATSIENNMGQAIVSLPGSGLPLVSAAGASTLTYTQGGGGNLVFSLDVSGTSVTLSNSDTEGEFGGILNVRDQVIPDTMNKLDTMAYVFADRFNTQHAAGTGLDSSTGLDFFSYGTLASPPTNAALQLSVAISNTDQVAAGNSSAPGDNANALALVQLENAAILGSSTAAPPVGLDGDTFNAYYGSIASTVGVELNQNELTARGLEDSLNQLESLRDSTDGVSLEEEMIELMKYQQSFEASAKLMATIDEVLESLLTLKR